MDKKTQALVEQYAKSLVEIAIEKDSLAELQSETEALLSVFEETNLADFLSSLVVSRDEKVKLVRLLQESSSVYMNNFLEVILQNEREAFLKAILEGVQKDFVIATNQHDIVVTTAVALTDEQKSALIDNDTINYIYIKQFDEPNEVINNLIEGTNVEIVKLHMLTNLTENEISNKKDYFSIMNENIEFLCNQELHGNFSHGDRRSDLRHDRITPHEGL